MKPPMPQRATPGSPAALTMRELMALAREKLGADAARSKTRQELLVALGLDAAQQPGDAAPAREAPLVTRDFFVDPASPE